MKNTIFLFYFLGFGIFTFAQNNPKVGNELVINKPYAQTFNYVKFPKKNILIKRGKVASYNTIYGNTVVIDAICTKKNGDTYVTLKKKDGSKFFGYLKTVKANYTKSIDAGEMTAL